MPAYRGYNLIGSKRKDLFSKKDLDKEEVKHTWKVMKRRREALLCKIDAENGCFEPDEQILPPTFKGTHPLWETQTLWSYIKRIINDLNP